MSNPDLSRIINSDEIQSVLRPARSRFTRSQSVKKNPLKNLNVMLRLNPYAKTVLRTEHLNQEARAQSKVPKDKKVRVACVAPSLLEILKSD